MPNRKPDPIKHCKQCGDLLSRKRINGRLEDLSVFIRRQYCDQGCMAMSFRTSDDVAARATILKRARAFKGGKCEQCGTADRLQIHHKNRDWRDNSCENLQTLCARCHMLLHHANGDIKPRKDPGLCACGRPARTASKCDTCLSRRSRDRREAMGLPRSYPRKKKSEKQP